MKKKPAKSRPGLWISILASPFLALLLFMAWGTMHADEISAARSARRAVLEKRVSAVADVIQQSGAVAVLTKSETLEITVPHHVAMTMTTLQATELALTAREKTGVQVNVKSPAGQTLGHAP